MTIAVEVRDKETADLFGSNASAMIRFDRDTTCGCGVEVEYVGSSGKLIYYRGADGLFPACELPPESRNIKWHGTRIRPRHSVKGSKLSREFRALGLRVLRMAGRLINAC